MCLMACDGPDEGILHVCTCTFPTIIREYDHVKQLTIISFTFFFQYILYLLFLTITIFKVLFFKKEEEKECTHLSHEPDV